MKCRDEVDKAIFVSIWFDSEIPVAFQGGISDFCISLDVL